MFWFAFVSIVLFIIFLITILVSTGRTSTDKTLRSLKDELEEKNRAIEAKKASSSVKPDKPKKEPTLKEKVDDSVNVAAVAVESVPVVEKVITATKEPVVKEEPAPSVELPFIEEETVFEPEPIVEEVVVQAEPLIEVAAADEKPEKQADVSIPEVEPESLRIHEAPSTPEADEVIEEIAEVVVERAPEEVIEEEPGVEETVQEEVVEEVTYDYPDFDNTRTMEEFGLPKEEADEFIVDLIQQVDEEMPNLENAVSANDSHKIEEISHMIKGSATNLGTGGIADVLVDFNTYMKTDNDPAVIAMHMKNLRYALAALKEQFQ